MSSESNKYVFIRVKKDTRNTIKIQSALGGFKSMDDFLKKKISNEIRLTEQQLDQYKDKAKINKKGGFNIGF